MLINLINLNVARKDSKKGRALCAELPDTIFYRYSLMTMRRRVALSLRTGRGFFESRR